MTLRLSELDEHFLKRCETTDQAVSVINKLASDLVGGNLSRMRLPAMAEAVNSRLRMIKPMINKATASVDGISYSPLEVANSLGSEAALLSQTTRRDRVLPLDSESPSALREDAIASAISASSFYQCDATVSQLSITTAEGRRKGIEAGFMSGCAVIIKVLLWGDKGLAKRHPLLAKMLELRGGANLAGLVEYFTFVHAVDVKTGKVPQRAQKYSVAGDVGTSLEELQKFLKLNLHDVNWFCPRTGIYALRMAMTGAVLAPLDPRDYLCVVAELEELLEYGERRLAAIGVPITVVEGEGFTWRAWWTRYIAHLKLAKRAATYKEMVAWISLAVPQGMLALRLMGDSIKRFVDASFPATATITYLLAIDNPAELTLKAREQAQDRVLQERDLYGWLPTQGGQGTAPPSGELPRLSHASAQRAVGTSPVAQRQKLDAAGKASAGGQAHARWLVPGIKLLSSGYVWNAQAFNATYGGAYCIYFVSSNRSPHNAQLECGNQDRKGHQFPGDAAHVYPPGTSHETLRDTFAVKYDPSHSRARPGPSGHPKPARSPGNRSPARSSKKAPKQRAAPQNSSPATAPAAATAAPPPSPSPHRSVTFASVSARGGRGASVARGGRGGRGGRATATQLRGGATTQLWRPSPPPSVASTLDCTHEEENGPIAGYSPESTPPSSVSSEPLTQPRFEFVPSSETVYPRGQEDVAHVGEPSGAPVLNEGETDEGYIEPTRGSQWRDIESGCCHDAAQALLLAGLGAVATEVGVPLPYTLAIAVLCTAAAWALSRKERNKLMHANNGNATPPKPALFMPAADEGELTPLSELSAPFAHLAVWLKKARRGLVEQGSGPPGCNMCADYSISYCLRKLGYHITAQAIRTAVCDFADSEAVFHTYESVTDKKGQRTAGWSLARIIADAMANWPDLDKHLEGDESPWQPWAATEEGTRWAVKKWVTIMRQSTTFADVAYFHIIAHLTGIEILAYCISNEGKIQTPVLIRTAASDATNARIELAAHPDQHVMPVVFTGRAAQAPEALELRRTGEPIEGTSLYARCEHERWVLLSGTLDKTVGPRCSHTACLSKLRALWVRHQPQMPVADAWHEDALMGPGPAESSANGLHYMGIPGSLSRRCEHGWARVCGAPDIRLPYCSQGVCRASARDAWREIRQSCGQAAKGVSSAPHAARLNLISAQMKMEEAPVMTHMALTYAYSDLAPCASSVMHLECEEEVEKEADPPTSVRVATHTPEPDDIGHVTALDAVHSATNDAAAAPTAILADPTTTVPTTPPRAPPTSPKPTPEKKPRTTGPVGWKELVNAADTLDDDVDRRGVKLAYMGAKAARQEILSFSWPITAVGEFKRLLECVYIAPTDLVGCEFSAAVRSKREELGKIAISVDRRDTLVEGMHAKLDVRKVLTLK